MAKVCQSHYGEVIVNKSVIYRVSHRENVVIRMTSELTEQSAGNQLDNGGKRDHVVYGRGESSLINAPEDLFQL
jgi:hypothetical protein